MQKYLSIAVLLAVLVTGACSSPGQERQQPAHEHAAGHIQYTCPMHPQIVQEAPGTCPICQMDLVPVTSSGNDQGELMLSESQLALGNIAVKRIKTGTTGGGTLLTGRLVVDETRQEVISSRAAGRLERLFLKAPGQSIRQGQPLYALYSEQLLTLQQEYLLALQQQRELGRENSRFAAFLEAAKKKLLLYGFTEGQVRQLTRSGKADARLTFLAPASGVATEIAVAEGQYVTEGAVLYRLARLNKIWVEAELYPQEVARVRTGAPVQVQVQGMPQPVPAQVTFLSPEFRAGSQVAVLRAELPNAGGQYLPGMPATILLPGTANRALTLPADAVIRDEKGSHVWVQSGKNTFRARMVTLGEESADQVAILSGLQENDKVVVSGAYLLYSEFVLKKGTDPMAGHQH